ncbi:hypothetical protein BN1723_009812 [Verticillium longisporum]|uniref:Uncharacterized protein n=1 Tax=Verticillium longisporum TaxID=100787 RepID=A0A0G4KSX7_VERLO|nr:hypothetical protein BN1723_009812 [Verticillium longisporum]
MGTGVGGMEGAAPHGYVRVGDILASGLGKRGRHGGGQGPFIAVGKGRSLPLGVEDDGRGAKCMDACMMEGGTPAERLHKRVGPPWRGMGTGVGGMEGAAPHGYVRVGDILASGLGKRGRHGGGQGLFIAVGKGRSLPSGVEKDGRGAKCMDACVMEGGPPGRASAQTSGPTMEGSRRYLAHSVPVGVPLAGSAAAAQSYCGCLTVGAAAPSILSGVLP